MRNKIFELFKEHDIYLVGGTVRDQLLGIETNDLDFAVSCKPEVIKDILEKAGYKTHVIGEAFGTISIIDNNQKIEITTFRKNESYTRNNRRPVVEWGKTIYEDLARRDFTINAIVINSKDEILDPFNGVFHIKQGVIDTPIDPIQSFNDDPLRLLRAIRFKSKLGFKYSERVAIAILKQSSRVLYLPKERVLEELNKILMTDNPADALNDMLNLHLLHYIIPELTMLDKVDQTSPYHSKNVWEHTLGVLRNSPKDLVLRYAALFHDIGKISTYSIEDGTVHFFHHEEVSALMTEPILSRLGLPNKMIKDITYLVGNHMRANLYDKTWSDASVRRFIRDTGEYCDKLLALSRADITSHKQEKVSTHIANLEDLERRIVEQREFKESPKCPISGVAIMAYFNLPQCKKVGEIKDFILEAIVSGELKIGDDEDTMLRYANKKMEIINEIGS